MATANELAILVVNAGAVLLRALAGLSNRTTILLANLLFALDCGLHRVSLPSRLRATAIAFALNRCG